ncbi:MAG: ABC transporter permease [Alphaproteobacteria bacterium]|nr:ABC transporter permease [Alphaproteobacteria bacterium]
MSRRIAPGRLALWAYGLLVVVFLLAPIVIIAGVSFDHSTLFEFPPKQWSLRWYATLFASREWREAFLLSLWLAAGVTFLSLLFGVPAAYALARGRFPGQAAVEFFLVSPIVVPVIVLALGFYVLFAPLGLVGRPSGLLLAHTVIAMPVVIVIVRAAFRRTDPKIELAARACGASFGRMFWHVALPAVRPAVISGGAFAFLTSFDEVVLALFLGGPQAATLPKRIWEAVKFELDPSLTAISTLLAVLTIAVLVVAEFAGRRRRPPAAKES